MPKTMRNILRANEVQFQGPLRLGLELAGQPAPGSRPQPGPAPAHAKTEPRVRIAENHPDFALVELTCSCGQTTYVRCDYAGAETSPPAGKQ